MLSLLCTLVWFYTAAGNPVQNLTKDRACKHLVQVKPKQGLQ